MKMRLFLTVACTVGLICESLSFGQGFPNVPQVPGALLSGGLLEPQQGRTAIITYHNGWLYTVPEHPSSQPGSDYQARRWNLADPTNAQVMETLGISGGSTSAHGYQKIGDYLLLGGNGFDFIHSETGEHHFGPSYVFRAVSPFVNERTTYPQQHPIYSRGDLYRPYYTTEFWSYSDVDRPAILGFGDEQLAEWDHLGLTGVIGHPFIIGNLLIFASDQSRTGVATYDISDPTEPVLLDVLTTGGPGGYWPELWGSDGRLLIVFPYRTGGNGIRVVEVTDPTNMQFLADVPLPGATCMYAQFQDNFLFTGSHKVDMRTFQSVLSLDLDPMELDTSQFALPLGNLLVTGGAGPGQGMAIWAHQAQPDTTGPSVGYHIPRNGQANYPTTSPISLLIHETLESPSMINGETFIVRPLGGAPIPGLIRWTFNDSLTFTPDSPLLPNTTYEVVIPENGIQDAAGNGIEGYSFTFSTGETLAGNQAPVVSELNVSAYPSLPNQNINLTVAASDPEGDPLEYRFDFGDGTEETPWQTDASISHSYGSPGHYKVVAQVRDPDGSQRSLISTVTVTSAALTPAAPSSSPMSLDTGNRRLWVVNPDNNSVTGINADTQSVVFETAVGADPRSVANDAVGNAWVTCHDADQIDILDPDGALIDTIQLDYGAAPFGIVISPDGLNAFVSLQGSGLVLRLSTNSRSVIDQLPVGPTPRALAMTPSGDRLFVSRLISPLHRGEIWEINPTSMTLNRLLEIEKFGGNLHRDGTAEGMGVANYLTGLAVTPDGEQLFVTSNKMNTDKGTLSGPDLDHDNTVRNILSRFDISSGQFIEAIDIDNSDSASAVSFSPLGDYIFVTLQGNNDLLVLDRLALDQSTGLGSFVTRRGVGSAPQGVLVDHESELILVKNLLGRSITVLDSSELFRRGQTSLPAQAIHTVTDETLSPEIQLGKTLFYHAGSRMSGEGYISCATCHLDGGHDGRVWDFTGRGEGLRNSIPLQGRSGIGHGGVHWTANFDEIQDFEHDIRQFFGGSGFLTDTQFENTNTPLGAPKTGLSPDLDALAAYVTSLDNDSIPRSPHRSPTGALTSAGRDGHIIFNTLDCRTCHAGDETTDLNLHNVGTLKTTSGSRLGELLTGIETPTLRGLWQTAPYLHDGSAETLEDVFSAAGGTLYPAENGTPTAPAWITQGATVRINSDDTARGEAFVTIEAEGSLTLNDIHGGSGGIGALEIRYTHGDAAYPLIVEVNGQAHHLSLPPVQNGIPWRFVNWRLVRLENVPLNPGTDNTIVLRGSNAFFDAYIDDLSVSTADDLALANPHRQVLSIAPQDRANLMAFLRELDGSPIIDPLIEAPILTINPPANEEVLRQDPLVIDITASRGIIGFSTEDIHVSGSASPQSVELDEIQSGTDYQLILSGMQNAGSLLIEIPENAATDLAGQGSQGTGLVQLEWEPFLDDLAPLGDEFEDVASLDQWQRLNETEGWNADKLEQLDVNTSVPGHMRIMPHTTSWFMDLTGPLVYKEISGDFAVTMHMNVQRRNNQPGRPQRAFSLGGIMIRSPRNTETAAPQPNAPATTQLFWPPNGYQTDWQPDTENYIFLSVGTSDNTGPNNVWNYEVKTTVNGQSTLYYGREGVPENTGMVTLQAIRRGSTFVLLRRHEGGDWIIENRYDRPDMPETLQVGITTYTDWDSIVSNGMFTNSEDHARQYHHNRNVITDANGFQAQPDLVVDVDYVRYSRLRNEIQEQQLVSLPVSGGGIPQYLAYTPLAEALGDSLNQVTPPPSFALSVDWPQQVNPGAPVEFEVVFPQPVTGFDASDIVLSGTTGSPTATISTILSGTRYTIQINGMQQAGMIQMHLPEAAVTGADGRPSAATETFSIEWAPAFVDDLAAQSDEFDDASSLTDWQRLHLVEGWNADRLEAYDINQTVPGHLHLMPHSSTWYMDLVGPLTYKEISGDFIATLRIDISRRYNLPGRPQAYFSLGGLMLRAPRDISAAAPTPNAPNYTRLPWPPAGYVSDWEPNGEDYLFFSLGHSIGYPENQWNLQVKNTDNGHSEVYHSDQGIPADISVATLQIIRRGTSFLLLRKHGEGEWIIENRYERPDLPETIQVGISAYTDWASIAGNGLFTHGEDHEAQYHQNRNVISPTNGFGANPDLIANVDFLRFARPNDIPVESLLSAPLSATSNEVQWLANTDLAYSLGEHAHLNPGYLPHQTMSLSHPLVPSNPRRLRIEHDETKNVIRIEATPRLGADNLEEIWVSSDLHHWSPIESDRNWRRVDVPGTGTPIYESDTSSAQHRFVRLQSKNAFEQR